MNRTYNIQIKVQFDDEQLDELAEQYHPAADGCRECALHDEVVASLQSIGGTVMQSSALETVK